MFERLADKRIRDAMAAGEFDDLPNNGEPLDLEWYFALPADLRMSYALLKSAQCVPEEVALLREIAELEERLKAAADLDARAALHREIDSKRVHLAVLIEQTRRSKNTLP